MNTRLFLVAATAAVSLTAQEPMGTFHNATTAFTTRGGAAAANTANPGFAFTRFDQSHYAGWGHDINQPLHRVIVGITCVLQDQVGVTPESFGITCFGEDPGAPNWPLVGTPVASAGPFPTPASTATGATAFIVNVNFTTPALAPRGQDVFLAFELPQPATGTWPTDGLSVHATAGATEPAGHSYVSTSPELAGYSGYFVPASNTLLYSTPRQLRIDPLLNGPGGVAGTIHNIPTATPGNTAPGTASMFAGLFPDAQNPPLNAGRVDDLGARWSMTGIADGTPVMFLADFGAFGPEIPLRYLVLAGSQGVLCLNAATMLTSNLTFTTGGQAIRAVPVPAGARAIIAGLAIMQQGLALDLTANVAMANPCTRQIL